MKIKEITISKGFKMSKNYNSVDVSVSMTALLDETDKEIDVYDELSEIVDQNLEIEINDQITKLAKLAKERKFE
jgi:Ser-tRNA(Ala) deacylase AlaX